MQTVVPACGAQEWQHVFLYRDFSQWSAYWGQKGREWKTKHLLWKAGILFPKGSHEDRNQHGDHHPELWPLYIPTVLVWYSSSWEREVSGTPPRFPPAPGSRLWKQGQQRPHSWHLRYKDTEVQGSTPRARCYPWDQEVFPVLTVSPWQGSGKCTQ